MSWEPVGFQQGGGDPCWGGGLAAAAQRGTAESGEAKHKAGRFRDWGAGEAEGADLAGAEGAAPEGDSADVQRVIFTVLVSEEQESGTE